MILLIVLAQIASSPAEASSPPPDPVEALRGMVVENIRNCPKGLPGENVVCSKDRGFAEGYRLPKKDPRFEKPEPVVDGLTIGPGAPNRCATPDAVGKNDCTIRDYQQWLAWKRLQDAKSLDPR